MHVIRGRIDLRDLRISVLEDTMICGLIRNRGVMVPEGRRIVLNFPLCHLSLVPRSLYGVFLITGSLLLVLCKNIEKPTNFFHSTLGLATRHQLCGVWDQRVSGF